ncbi:DUF3240 domain-containing protein [Azoarcus communis]|uniref:DUF3240 family protein n=1 Tax=Parazoarcus communis TaxID=41977 RepID=UPI001459F378|nr:DUF3240 family protein [Parazoarcus communis]NMG46915.1 DUF3240 domain-containing protein [Parazoarcus communis]
MSDAPLLLTLIVPHELEEAVADALLARPDLTSGFSSMTAEGHGSSIQLVEADELVCGHVRRKRMDTVCDDREHADAILVLLRGQFAGANLYYWLTPVLAHGRVA